ncbi:methyl-accepting chemotaxis protein IV [Escherichia coli]|nr:methyl-accepting chemotaxis protein IV [Escherichia coli]
MINRIRVVTLLVMVLGVFALLQLISGSLFFSSLHHSQKSFVVSNQLREQQGELTSTWDLMLQTRINLSRSAVRMMMDSSNQQSNAKVELLDSARKTLAQAATHYKKFKSMAPLPEMVATSRNIDEKYKNYYTALTELIDYLDYGNTGAYFAQPTQGMQNAMGEAFAQYALSSEKLYRDIVTDNADDYRFAQWQLAVIALVVVFRAVMLQASTALNKAGTLTALSYPADDIKTLMTTARASLTQSTTLFKSFMAMTAGNEHVRGLQKETEKSFARWHNDLEHQATWLESNQLSDFLTAPVQGSQNAFDVNFEAWQLEINHVLEAASAQSQRNYQISALVFISMIIVAAIYISSALWWTRKMIVQPLAIIGSHFDSIAAGNLARPIAVYGRNEITAIFASLKTMQQALRGTVSDVRKGSQEMHIGIAEIVAGNNDLSSRTEQQAASLAQTAASMEQLTATVGQNADNARQASELAKNAATTAQAGGVQVSTMTHTMQEIATSSQKIGDIISVIDGIAFQTNILALNAAVEAARAGEQGRGFAVVAGEVRNLASRSAQAAKEIKGLIEESVNRVQQGSKLVNNAAATMTDIVSSVTRVNDIMGEIASASEEQRRGIEQVAQAVSQMDQVTQQNASLVEEAAVATEQLANQADHLSSRVAVFTLEEHEVARHESAQLQIAPVVS